ncbi:SDR family oxidoreductase [soil metagenome]
MTYNSYDFADSTVIVTGAGSGIGRAIATAFLDQGATVVVAGRRPDALAETVAPYPAEKSLTVAVDLSTSDGVQHLVEETVRRFGKIDVVVSNAAAYSGGEITELTDDAWQRLRSINVDALVYLARAIVPHLESSGGNLVAVSSVSGIRGDWGQAAYNATKGAVNTLIQSLALDLGARGIRVNAVAPSFTITPMTGSMATDEQALAPFIDRIALERPALPEDIAPAVLFLASADAAYITGVILPVDGGTSASTGQPR